MTINIRNLFLAVLCLGLGAFPATAQQNAPAADTPMAAMAASAPVEDSDAVAPAVQQDFSYEPLTLDNLVKLYWKTRLLDPENKDSVVDYMRTSECDLYTKFSKDDFKWPEIIRASRDYLKKYRDAFPSRFSIKQPLGFERFDPDKKWFRLTGDTVYLNVEKLEIANFYSGTVQNCGVSTSPKYPLSALLQIARPFSITYVPMTEEFAREYLAYIENAKAKPGYVIGSSAERPAFVEFRVTITGVAKAPDRMETTTPVIFSGTLDSYGIFADKELTLPLFQWSPDDKKLGTSQLRAGLGDTPGQQTQQ